jgi:hypothetical protein
MADKRPYVLEVFNDRDLPNRWERWSTYRTDEKPKLRVEQMADRKIQARVLVDCDLCGDTHDLPLGSCLI